MFMYLSLWKSLSVGCFDAQVTRCETLPMREMFIEDLLKMVGQLLNLSLRAISLAYWSTTAVSILGVYDSSTSLALPFHDLSALSHHVCVENVTSWHINCKDSFQNPVIARLSLLSRSNGEVHQHDLT